MTSSLRRLLAKIIKKGSLSVSGPVGSQTFGNGGGRSVSIRFTDAKAEEEIAADPQLKLAEVYMDGRLIFEEGDVYDLLALVKDNTLSEALTPGMIWRGLYRVAEARVRRAVPVNRNQRNVAHHYDLSAKLFDLFLDEDWQYSCAYFETPEATLEQAQVAKKRRLIDKLVLSPGQRALDIGCGWGGLGLSLAEAGAHVTGVTLSTE